MTIFIQIKVFRPFFRRLTVHIDHTTGSEPKMPKNRNISQYQ